MVAITASLRRVLEHCQAAEPKMLSAGRATCPQVREAFFDFRYGQVKIIVDQSVPSLSRRAVAAAVGAVPELKAVPRDRINVRSAFDYSYSLHDIPAIPQRIESGLNSAVVFDVQLAELERLVLAYDEAATLAAQHDRVATFATGGMPLLTHITDCQCTLDDPEKADERLREWQAKFNLFAGLNWGTGASQATLEAWLQDALVGNGALLLDTGTSGNGVRECFRIAKDAARTAAATGAVGKITVLGIVDGVDADQVASAFTVTGPNGGNVDVSVAYLHVPRIFSEDCDPLLGYAPNRTTGVMRPTSQLGVLRILGNVGIPGRFVRCLIPKLPSGPLRAMGLRLLSRLTPCTVMSTRSTSAGLRAMCNDTRKRMPLGTWFPNELHKDAAALVLSDSRQVELEIIGTLSSWGMISARDSDVLRRDIEHQYKRLLELYPDTFWTWDRSNKKPVRSNDPHTFWNGD